LGHRVARPKSRNPQWPGPTLTIAASSSGDGNMDDLIKICEDNLSEHEFLQVKAFLETKPKKAPYSLRAMCRRNPELMASTISGIVLLERIKSGTKPKRETRKKIDSQKNKVIKKYVDGANLLLEMNPDNRKQLKKDFSVYLGSIHQYLDPLPKDDICYNEVLKILVEELQKENPHTENAVLKYLSELLNELGCKSPQNKSFTRQILRSLIKS
jgi:hypothetical protein